MSTLPPSGGLVARLDQAVFALAESRGVWTEVDRRANVNTTQHRLRYGHHGFEFTSRTEEPTRVLWGRYVGKPGAFDQEKFYDSLNPHRQKGRF